MSEEEDYTVTFSHTEVGRRLSSAEGKYTGSRTAIQSDGSLMIRTGVNNITWGYGLNSITYPTYGGEVVQNLSAYIDDLSVSGTVVSYKTMEEIYLWFLTYMAVATQGEKDSTGTDTGAGRFNEDYVNMVIVNRQWAFHIRPKTLPGLKYAREVVAPTWSITAAIVESDSEVHEATLKGASEGLALINPGIGYEKFNPFSAPTKIVSGFQSVQKGLDTIGSVYKDIVTQYDSGDFSSQDPPPSGIPPEKKTPTKKKDSKKKN